MRARLLSIFFAILVLPMLLYAQGPTKTEIKDTLYDNQGNLASGTLVISSRTFTSPDGYPVPSVQTRYAVQSGSLDVFLVPNIGANPSGTSYTVTYQITNGLTNSETWVVPQSGSAVNLLSIRALSPPLPTVMLAYSQLNPPANCLSLGGIPLYQSSGWTCTAGGGGSGGPTLQTNGVNNGSQVLLNMIQGAAMTVTNSIGGVTFSFSGSSLNLSDFQNTHGSDGQVPIWNNTMSKYVPGDPIVSGPDAPGSAPTRNPVQMGSFDGANVQRVLSDTGGRLIVNVNSLPALPAGANVIGAVTQSGGPWSVNVTQIGGVALALGSTTSTASIPVVIASDQAAIAVKQATAANLNATVVFASAQPVTQSGGPWTANVTQIGGVALAFGQSTMSGSIPVVLASNQSNINVVVASALPAGANTIGTVNLGTVNGLALDATVSNVQGSISGGTAGSKSNLAGGIFNTVLPTLTNGQQAAFQFDSSGRILMNCSAGCGGGSGGTSIADEGAFTAGTTSITPMGGIYSTGSINLTTGQAGVVRLTADRRMMVDLENVGGTALTLGSTTSSASIPVVIASDQAAVAVKQTTAANLNATVVFASPQAVTQSSGPWTANITQIGGSALALGQTTMSASIPVVIASNQSNLSIVFASAQAVTQSGNWTARVVGNGGATLDATVGAATAPTNGLAVLGIYNNATPPAPTDGQSAAMQLDQAGNLRAFNGVSLKTLSTQGTSLNNTQTILTNSGAEAVLVQLTQTTTITGGAITFEFTYDGANFLAVPANDVLDPTSATFAQVSLPYTLQQSTNKQFLILMNGAQGLRIRTSTAITGSGSVTPNYALQNFSPAPNIVAFSPTAANFNATVVFASAQAVTQSGGPWTANITQIGGASLALGQTTMSASIPVTIASNQSSLGVTLAAETTKVIGTIRLLGNGGAILDFAGQNSSSPANSLLVGCQFNTSPTTITNGNSSPEQCDNVGDRLVKVNAALPTGANTIGAVTQASGPWTANITQIGGSALALGSTTSSASIPVVIASDQAAVSVKQSTGANLEMTPMASGTTTDASTECVILTTSSTNSTSCKGSAGNFYGYDIYNSTTTIYYLRLYNSSSAPTCSSATGFIRTIPLIPTAASGGSGGQILALTIPVGYGTGIGYCITGGSTSTDNTNAAAGIFGAIRYK